MLIYFLGYISRLVIYFNRWDILAGWAAASRSGDEACPGESQTGPGGEYCTELMMMVMMIW